MTTPADPSPIDEEVLQALRTVNDPEIGMNIVDLGLVYEARRTEGGIRVAFTVTSPACPLGESMTRDTEEALRRHFPDAREIDVQLVFEPPWTPDRMTETGRKQLGLSPP